MLSLFYCLLSISEPQQAPALRAAAPAVEMFHNSIIRQREQERKALSNSVLVKQGTSRSSSRNNVSYKDSDRDVRISDVSAASQIQQVASLRVLNGQDCEKAQGAPRQTKLQASFVLNQVNSEENWPRQDSAGVATAHQVVDGLDNPSGKPSSPPKPYELYKIVPQSLVQCYKAVATFSYVCFFLVKNEFLVWEDGTDMRGTVASINKSYHKMVQSVTKLKNYDFSWLQQPRTDYATQEEISQERVKATTACAIHYGNDIGLVTRYLGREYTGAWRDIPSILAKAAPYVNSNILKAMKRILNLQVPSNINWEESAENKQAFIDRGNNPSIEANKKKVDKTMNKEERNSHAIPFESFLLMFSAYARLTPQHLRQQEGKKDRLIWNGKGKAFGEEVTMNEVTDMMDETPITFGIVYISFITWIYNMRITYPDEDILLAYIDISSCFRFPRIHPDLVGAFGFLIGSLWFAANAMVFGSVASASSWEPFRVAIAAMATAYFCRTELVQKHKDLLSKISWETKPTEKVHFVQAKACTKCRGVLNDDGTRVPSPHNIYVDDNLMADIRSYMPQVLASAAEAVFDIMGWPVLKLRQSALAMDKWVQLHVSHACILLGLYFNTREMVVGISDEYREATLDLLTNTWHRGRQSFDVGELEKMIGKVGRIGQAYRPILHLMPHMYSSAAYALKENKHFLMGTSRKFREAVKKAKTKPASDDKQDTKIINFAVGQVAKMTHGSDRRYRIPPSLEEEIAFVRAILADKSIKLCTPFAHIVDREPDIDAGADSCKRSGGGWCIDLLFWWFIPYKLEVIQRAYLPDNSSGLMISINALEMVCVIINLAATIYACWHDGVDLSNYPVLHNWCDNKAAGYWVNNKCRDSLIGRALGRFFCGLLMSTNLGIQCEWLSTKLNKVADDISRLEDEDGNYDYSQLLTDHPSLQNCRQFQPSDTLLTMIYDILLRNDSPDPLIIRQLKPQTLGSFISSST